MNRHCKCGGRIVNTGLEDRLPSGQRQALFRCDKCGKQYSQRLRMPDKKLQDEEHLTEADYQTWMRL